MRFIVAIILILTGSASAATSAPWSYSGPNGPQRWAQLSKKYAACGKGQNQSPVDLRFRQPQSAANLIFAYESGFPRIIDTGRTVELTFNPGSHLMLRGERYDLVHLDFHSLSEHTLSGQHFPMEMQLTHRNAEGRVAIVGVMFKQGEKNAALAKIWRAFPRKGRAEARVGKEFNPDSLIPSRLSHYSYVGSLTTPPCTEGVEWIVLNTPIEASRQQIQRFRRMYARNNRPVQKLYNRRPANFQ